MTDDELNREIEVWKTAIGVQRHFNDIEMKVRNYALTLLLAVGGAAALAVREGTTVDVFGWDMSLATGLLVVGLIAWAAFWFMDKGWYHRLLVGSVKHAITIENRLKDQVPGIALSTAIGDESPFTPRFSKKAWHSPKKLNVFYGTIAVVLLLLAIGVQLAAPDERGGAAVTCSTTGRVATCETRDGSFTCEPSGRTVTCAGKTNP